MCDHAVRRLSQRRQVSLGLPAHRAVENALHRLPDVVMTENSAHLDRPGSGDLAVVPRLTPNPAPVTRGGQTRCLRDSLGNAGCVHRDALKPIRSAGLLNQGDRLGLLRARTGEAACLNQCKAGMVAMSQLGCEAC